MGPEYNGSQMGPERVPNAPRALSRFHGPYAGSPGSMGPMQDPGAMGPMQDPGSMGPMQDPGSMGPMQDPSSMGLMQDPGSMGPMQAVQDPWPLCRIQVPRALCRIQGPWANWGPFGFRLGPIIYLGPILGPFLCGSHLGPILFRAILAL